MINGALTSRVRKQERLTHEREKLTSALFVLTRELSKARGIIEVINIAVEQVRKNLTLI
jgi:two-component system sensor histidine kinase KdpD